MEVTHGHKKTKLGVLPAGWDFRRLGEIAVIRDGTHQTPKYVQSGIPFFSVEHVTSGDFNNTKFITKEEHKLLTRSCKIEMGDILMTRIGSIGDCKLIDWEVEASFYVSLALLKIDKRFSAAYITHFSKSNFFQKEVEMNSLQSAIPRKINLGSISKVRVLFPPIEEQNAIATALSDVDALLTSLDRLITKKRDLKQAAMQQLLTGQTRLPGVSGEWEMKKLGDVVEIKKGQLITSSTLKLGDIPVIAGGKQPAYYNATANRFGRSVTISASGASAGYVALYNEPIFASDCSTIGESDGYCLDFVYFQLLNAQQTIYKAQTGGAQPHIHAKDLNPIIFAYPSHSEQTAIADVLLGIDKELKALEQRRIKTAALKQGMMQELLTGRTRLV
jgi:type I restriction enzyme S subunit